jgi:hypothetical protein
MCPVENLIIPALEASEPGASEQRWYEPFCNESQSVSIIRMSLFVAGGGAMANEKAGERAGRKRRILETIKGTFRKVKQQSLWHYSSL